MRKSERLIVGLMSGTSHDGVDAALVRVRGTGARTDVRLIQHTYRRYPPALRARIRAAFTGTTADVCRLHFDIAEVFARTALRCAEQAGVSTKRIAAVASHGQTLWHIPPVRRRSGATLQVGEPAVIARRTGLPVVSNFRAADIAAGGQGAPLVPYADWVLFHGPKTRVALNIGGIANLTVVTPGLSDVTAFDTGPGNILMDEAMRTLFGKPFDRNGRTARAGHVDERLLSRLLRQPYFRKGPPKSTGRETFGPDLSERLISDSGRRPEDLVATLSHLTARSICDALERFVIPGHEIREVIVSGGGAGNTHLIALLRELLAPIRVSLIDDYGIPSQAKEALSFAVLANETLSGNPSNVPSATGAHTHAVLGSITTV